MANVCILFEKIDSIKPNETRKGKFRPGYERVNVHMKFDIKMDGRFTRKARMMADGHTT